MARLNKVIDSDEEFPDLPTIFAQRDKVNKNSNPDRHEDLCKITSVKTNSPIRAGVAQEMCSKPQRTLKPVQINALFLPAANTPMSEMKKVNAEKFSTQQPSRIRSSPRKAVKNPNLVFQTFSNLSESEDIASDNLSDFIVSDSDSDTETLNEPWANTTYYDGAQKRSLNSVFRDRTVPISGRNGNDFTPAKGCRMEYCLERPQTEGSSRSIFNNLAKDPVKQDAKGEICPETSRISHTRYFRDSKSPINSGLSNGYYYEEPLSVLQFSPPISKSPSRSPPAAQIRTPPITPSKAKLLSPSKKYRIPPSPHRPSIDAFWSQEVINNWNDQHSPKKTPKPSQSRARGLVEDSDECLSPCESNLRSSRKSPVKRDRQSVEERKAFNEKKHAIAVAFLKELDDVIVNGEIASLAASTGGVQLTWSKKLQSTAGRANWKRESIRSKSAEGKISTTEYRHHASIELAEKVIDCEDRLLNVIAHEYCHLLNFMISNVKDNPHGKEFKAWGRKCSKAFAHRGIIVTTKHTYEIAYKYIWSCTHCGTEYKRHSKSIDPARHSCGNCKEKLIQVKPVPRGEGKAVGAYQMYVKEHFSRVKGEKPELTMGEVMVVLGKEFREKKKRDGARMKLIEEAEAVEADEGSNPATADESQTKDEGLDAVVRKLDFLDLS